MDGKIPSLNLISQVRSEAITGPAGFYKSIVLDCLTVLSALYAGYVYAGYLDSRTSLTIFTAAFSVFSALSIFQVLLIKSLGRKFFVLILEIAAFLFYFYSYDLKLLETSALIILTFCFWGAVSVQNELKNGLKIEFFGIARSFFGKFVTAFTLVLIILYLQQWNQNKVFVSEKTFQVFFDWTVGFTNNFYPDLNINYSFDKFSENLNRIQLQENAAYKALNPDNQQITLKKAVSEIRVSLGTRLGISISPGESTEKVIYDFLVKTLNDWKTRFQGFFTVGWVIAVFLILRGFGSIFSFLISSVSFIIYQILLLSDFMHIINEPVTKEVIEF